MRYGLTKQYRASQELLGVRRSRGTAGFATIRAVELRGDCMTTTVAMTAQYASGILTSRASNTESVAATAVLMACATDGRFSFFQVQSFIPANPLRDPLMLARLLLPTMSRAARDSRRAYVAFGKPNADCGATSARSRRLSRQTRNQSKYR